MVRFDSEHRAVHYPPDRRFRIWIRPSILIGIGVAILSVIAAAWIEVALTGLPHVSAIPQIYPNNFAGPHGFPVWTRYCHMGGFVGVYLSLPVVAALRVIWRRLASPAPHGAGTTAQLPVSEGS